MIYRDGQDWREATAKRVLLFGMSGLGKTYLSNMLRNEGDYFHYSVDYRIGTRYMGEHIADNFKREAMKVPLLRDLLLSDSIYVASNITFENLAPLSTYLGKPGNPDRGGLDFDEYLNRQSQHRDAEIAAMADTIPFIDRARIVYGYDNFVCDTSGSICEIVDPFDPDDPLLATLQDNLLLVWLKGTTEHTTELARRFDRAPKPMYYQPAFLAKSWNAYRALSGDRADQVNPDDFMRWTYARALDHRQPRYAAMAERGLTIGVEDLKGISTPTAFDGLIANALDARAA